MAKRSDPNPDYWDDYTPFQQVKHDLIRCYLSGWYPKLGYWAGRVLYVDTHAGRGKYETGDPGSPVVALQTLLNHDARDSLLKQSECNFLFLERDPENAALLEREITSLHPLPKRINIEVHVADTMDERIEQAIEVLRRRLGAQWATPVVRMVTGGTATRYVLVHFTKSDDGRDLMKNCRWSIFPDGEFRVRKKDDLGQATLFEPEANLAPVRAWVLGKLQQGPIRWKDLLTAVRTEDWLEKHVNETVRVLKAESKITHSLIPAGRKFSAAVNPVLQLRK